MTRNAKASVPRCQYTLTRNRPTPGTRMAKSASLVSMNSFMALGCMIDSASALRSAGVSGARSSICSSSPATRIVGLRPTLSSMSEPRFSAITLMAFWKNTALGAPGWGGGPAVGPGATGALGIGLHPEKDLSELDRLRVVDEHLAHAARDFGLDFVHDLHRLDDAERVARRDAAAGLHVGIRAGLGRTVERAHHRRLDIDQVARRGVRRCGLRGGLILVGPAEHRVVRGRREAHHRHAEPAHLVGGVALLDLEGRDGARLEERDQLLEHADVAPGLGSGRRGRLLRLLGHEGSSQPNRTRSLGNSVSNSARWGVSTTSSSIRTPPQPSR